MDEKELAQLLMQTFLEELQEHVGKINQFLLSLEKESTPKNRAEMLKLLFRSAHTIKGSSMAVNVPTIERTCHELEEILTGVRDAKLELNSELFALLFETADAIEEASMRLREDQNLDGSSLEDLIPKLQAAAIPGGDLSGKTRIEQQIPIPVPTAPIEEAPLPAATPASGPTALPVPTTPPTGDRPEQASETTGSSEISRSSPAASVRVAAEKLDSLLARSGELLIARRRVASRTAEIEEIRDQVTHWIKDWTIVEVSLRKHGLFGDRTEKSRLEFALPPRVSAILTDTRDKLRQLERRLDQLASTVQSDGRHLDTTCSALDDEVHRVRMLPFTEACGGLERAARDVARKSGKEIELILKGKDVEIDRSVLEGIKDPLLHLVRNAVDHGVELPDERRAAGKSPTAQITISAALQGNQVEVLVSDDGRGVNLERVRQKAIQKGLSVPSDERGLVRMLFHSGFSTAPIVTDVSGRGVGLDVVRSEIEALHGSVDVDFEPGQGTQFTIQVPLTLTTIRNVLVEVGKQTVGFPTTNVQQLVRFRAEDLRPMGGCPTLLLGDAPIPVVSLADTLGLPRKPIENQSDRKLLAVIAAVSNRRVALIVDQVFAEQELVVKNLGRRIKRLPHISGGSLLASGDVALVLNVANVIQTALGERLTDSLVVGPSRAQTAVPRLLVVDDSVTTRTLWKSILEAAGYVVETAVDGADGWKRLENADVDLVVSDVDMPHMNGFELTSQIRGSLRHAKLPVVLVTARGTEEDKIRGIQVGADAYIVKTAFDQRNLLDTITQLL